MIFITYGTEKFEFARLTDEISTIINKNSFQDQRFVIQMGASYKKLTSSFNNVETFKYCSSTEFIRYIDQSDIVITHAGVGNIITMLEINKIPIVISRLKKYKEHVDDHQIQIAEELARSNYIVYLEDISELENYILNYQDKTQNLKHYTYSRNSIGDYINKTFLT